MRYAAIPRRADGTDKLGTEGVMLADYVSTDNALRYFAQRRDRYNLGARALNGWNVYRLTGWAGSSENYAPIGTLDRA